MTKFIDMITDNPEITAAIIGAVALFIVAIFQGRKKIETPVIINNNPPLDIDALAEKLAAAANKDREEIAALKKTIEALQAEKGPGIEEALELLSQGDTSGAEAAFDAIADRGKAKRSEGGKEAAAALVHKGNLAFLHDTQKALAAYREATELDPSNPDAWNRLGRVLFRTGDLKGAEAAYLKVAELAGGDKEWQAIAYGNLGIIYMTRGDLAKAEEFYLKALNIDEEMGNKEGMAVDYGNFGIIYQTLGDLAKAEEFYLKALNIDEEMGNKEGMAADYGNLGIIYKTRGDLPQAEEFYLKGLEIDKELGRKEGMAAKYGNLGEVYRIRGYLPQAEEFYLRALNIAQEMGDKEKMAINYGNLGILAAKKGDIKTACEHWQKARNLFQELGAPHMVAKHQAWLDDAGCGK